MMDKAIESLHLRITKLYIKLSKEKSAPTVPIYDLNKT